MTNLKNKIIAKIAKSFDKDTFKILVDSWIEQQKGNTKDGGCMHQVYDKDHKYTYTLIYGRIECKNLKELYDKMHSGKKEEP